MSRLFTTFLRQIVLSNAGKLLTQHDGPEGLSSLCSLYLQVKGTMTSSKFPMRPRMYTYASDRGFDVNIYFTQKNVVTK
jgi:hypothetical protein